MNPEDIGRILDEIGERIGPAGEYAWELAVRQVYIEGFIGTIVGTVLVALILAAVIVALVFIFRRYQADLHRTRDASRWDRTDPFGYAMSAFALVLFAGFAVGGIGTWALISVQLLLNPEYHAMMRLLERVVPQ